MIKSAKKAIYGVIGNSDVTDEELITAVTGVESLLNSRPLTYQSANPQDIVAERQRAKRAATPHT